MGDNGERSFDVAVVGAGVIGLSCAWKLAQRGLKVVLLERLQTGREASFAAGGMLAPCCESALHPWNCSQSAREEMLKMCFASRDMYPAFAADLWNETGQDIELSLRSYPDKDWQEWREPGILYIPPTQEDPRLTFLVEHGTCTEFNGRSAVLLTDDGQVENRKLVSALKAACVKEGVEIRETTMVRQLVIHNSRIIGLSDQNSTISAGHILLCAGAWSGKIGGVPPEISGSLRPLAGQMIQVRGEKRVKQVIYTDNCYLVPRRDGRLNVGATMEDVGFQKRVTAGGVWKLLQAACILVPELEDAPLESHWSGLRPTTPDNLPLLGSTSLEGLTVATGHGRNGILLAPATANAITELLVDKREISPEFSPSRFAAAT